jgi:hypothetical protein
METVKFDKVSFFLLLLITAGLLALMEYGQMVPQQGALLLTVVFWASLAQGCVAIVAVTDLTRARWIVSVRRELLCAVHLLPLLFVLLLLLIPRMPLYPWVEAPGLWLNEPFFLIRNLVLFALVWWSGWRFARRSLAGDPGKIEAAVLYLFIFVTSQSLVAYDLVMSLEYPWFSSLLGAYYFVESLYAAVALAALIFYFLYAEKEAAGRETAKGHLRDVALLLFGFSVLWTGLFFSQYLLIWYGNLPEEVVFIVDRIATPLRRGIGVLTIVGAFLIPFLVLISRRAKENPAIVAFVATAVLVALFLERLLYILPAVPLSPGLAVFQNLFVLFVWLLAINSHNELLPRSEETRETQGH